MMDFAEDRQFVREEGGDGNRKKLRTWFLSGTWHRGLKEKNRMRGHRGKQSVLDVELRRESQAQATIGFEGSLATFDIYGLKQKGTTSTV